MQRYGPTTGITHRWTKSQSKLWRAPWGGLPLVRAQWPRYPRQSASHDRSRVRSASLVTVTNFCLVLSSIGHCQLCCNKCFPYLFIWIIVAFTTTVLDLSHEVSLIGYCHQFLVGNESLVYFILPILTSFFHCIVAYKHNTKTIPRQFAAPFVLLPRHY